MPRDRFHAFGRANCYYTVISLDTADGNTCRYRFPVPRCTDADTAAVREYTAGELATYTAGDKFPAKTDGTTPCGVAAVADPPALADFDDDPCVTVDLEIYENRTAGSGAEPGVPASDRTLAVASGRTAWDLDVTSPHPRTASPPRDATAGTGDPSGCADGSESRADHAATPAGAARTQNPAPSYASSLRTDTSPPPNDADDDIDYSGAAKSMSHRYASKIAENTCSVKLAEAEAELALLEAREAAFAQWLTNYQRAATTNAGSSGFGGYAKAAAAAGSGLAVARFNDLETAKQTYADSQATNYRNLATALGLAKTAYDLTTDRSTGSNRAAVIAAGSDSGCAAHYDGEITRLKRLFTGAETTAKTSIAGEKRAISGTSLDATPAIANNDSPMPGGPPPVTPNSRIAGTRTVCLDTEMPNGGCWRNPAPGEICSGPLGACPGRTRPDPIYEYQCPGGTYIASGTVSRRYKTDTRTASYSTTYTAAARGWSADASPCPGWASALTAGHSYATHAAALSAVLGSPPAVSRLPAVAATPAAASLQTLGKASLLGSYYPSHGDRANLKAAASSYRSAAGNSLSVSAGSVPDGSPQETADYQTAYTTAYDNAYTQATGHMSGTSWEYFDWRYETSTLAWDEYEEDSAATFSASTETPRDGTGCDLVAVASDGTVTVEATRLDFEASSYGNATVYGTRTDAQRTCKIKRTRTPELRLIYAPPAPAATCPATPTAPCGTDTSKVRDRHLDGDTDTTRTHEEFFYIDYQPTTAAERFKLYEEAEIFVVRTGLADTAPTFCWAPGTMKISHAAEGRTAGPPRTPGAFLMESGEPSPRHTAGSSLTQTITVKTGGTSVPTSVYHDVCTASLSPRLPLPRPAGKPTTTPPAAA